MRLSLLFIGLFISLSAKAITLPPVPTEPIYFEPPVMEANEEQRQLSCTDLDYAINQLHPYRYSYKPNFYRDGANKAAVALVSFDIIPIVEGWIGLGYLGYSALVSEKESRRQLIVEEQINALQRLKAQKHCYE